MRSLKNRTRAIPLVVLAIVVMGGAAAFAQRQMMRAEDGKPEVKVQLSGTVRRDGQAIALDKAESVQPGEVLEWKIVSENEGTAPAREYKTVGRIPAGTAFVAGSAVSEGGSVVTYSIDGGKTFSALPVIEEKQPDGTTKKVAAPVSMYTEVRYEWSDKLDAGTALTASYKVRVK